MHLAFRETVSFLSIVITECGLNQVFGSLLIVLILICFGNSHEATTLPG